MIKELDYYDSCDERDKETIDLDMWRLFINQQQETIMVRNIFIENLKQNNE